MGTGLEELGVNWLSKSVFCRVSVFRKVLMLRATKIDGDPRKSPSSCVRNSMELLMIIDICDGGIIPVELRGELNNWVPA